MLICSLIVPIKTKIFIWISTCILVIVSGFRYQVGTDYNTYVNIIQSLPSGQSVHTEPGFNILIHIINYIGGSYQLVFLIFAFLTVLFFVNFIINNSKFPMLSIFIFFTLPVFYLASLNQIRQFLAVSLFAFSLKFIFYNKYIKYFISIIIASTIHTSAILMLPLYFILKRQITILGYLGLSFIYILILQFYEIIINVLGFSPLYLRTVGEKASTDPLAYFLLIIFIIFCAFKRYLTSQEHYFLNLLFLAILISFTPLILDIKTSYIIRMSSFFTIAVIVLIPNFIKKLEDLNIRHLYLLSFTSISSLYFFYTLIINGTEYNLIPYNFNLAFF